MVDLDNTAEFGRIMIRTESLITFSPFFCPKSVSQVKIQVVIESE